MQTADSVAAKSSIGQLDFAARPLRELWRENRLSLFRGGIDHRAAFSGNLAKFPVADGDCVLDFRFAVDRWDIYRS